MRLIIKKCLNRLKLIKFFRSYIYDLPLIKAVYYADNLPYVFDHQDKPDIQEIQTIIKDFTIFSVEDNEEDKEINIYASCYNLNINPPQTYIEAMDWYETLSDEHKKHIDEIVLWRHRPGVC